MKKRKKINKIKFYKILLIISMYINFLLLLALASETGLLSKILDYILIIY